MATGALVVALVAALALLAGRRIWRPWSRRTPAAIAIETATAIGDRRSLVIVAVEGRRLLLGVTPTGVALVTELSPGAQTVAGRLDRAAGAEHP